MEPRIDPEFQSVLEPLTEEEKADLHESLLRDGCREPILTWQGLIIDGMHRAEFCWAEGIPFETRAMEFDSRRQVRIWMRQNQGGRRNMSLVSRAKMGVAQKHDLAEEAKERQRKAGGDRALLVNSPKAPPPSNPINSRDSAAQTFNISGKTIDAMESVMDRGTAPLNRLVESRSVGIEAAAAVASLPKDQQNTLVKAGPAAVKAAAKAIREHRTEQAGEFDHLPVAIRPVFIEAAIYDEMANCLTKLSTLYNRVSGSEGGGKFQPMKCGAAIADRYDEGMALIRQLRHFIVSRKPFNVCPYCRAKAAKCAYCKNQGFVTRHQWDKAPAKLREGVKCG